MPIENLPPVVFLADKDTAGTVELYVSIDGGAKIIKLSGPMTPGGNVVDFKLSLDGLLVVYLADQITDEIFELFVSPVNGSAVPTTPVSGPMIANGDVVDFQISSVGTQVAYVADQITNGVFELFITASDGSAIPVVPASDPMAGSGIFPADGSIGSYSFDWSPDDNWIAYVADQDVAAIFELFTVQISNGTVTNISSIPPAIFEVDQFEWEPDSSRVAYQALNPALLQVELYSDIPSGGLPFRESRNLVPPFGEVIEFGWSPGGFLLAYIANAFVDTRFELWTTRSLFQDNFLPSGALPVGSVTAFAWAPNSQLIAFIGAVVLADLNELFVSNPVSVNPNPNPISGITNPDGDVSDVAWAPNSGRLAFIADATADEVFELFSVLPNGSSLRTVSNLSDPDSDVKDLAWSPDSSLIAFRIEQATTGVIELITARPSGTSNNNISNTTATGGQVQQYQWEPGGEGIGFIADQDTGGQFELYLSLPDGSDVAKVSGPLAPLGNVKRFEWVP